MSDFDQRRAALSPAAAERLRQRLQQEPRGMQPHIPLYPRTSDTLPLSFAQQRLWLLDQIDPHNVSYNVPVILRWRGPLQVSLLEQALNQMVARHENLRTFFTTREGQPRQQFKPTLTLPLSIVTLGSSAEGMQSDAIQQWMDQEMLLPFELAQGPLLRWSLAALDSDDHILLIVIHHIIFDGWSVGVMTKELTGLYEALLTVQSTSVPTLLIQYGDYALWQREHFQDPAFLDKQLRYWKETLAGTPPILELPTDFPRPPTMTHAGKRPLFPLPEELHRALIEFSQREKATLFITALAAFQILLYRYTGSLDIVVGTPIATRTYKETEPLIGLLLNALVLRTKLKGNLTCSEVVAQVRTVALNAFSNQEAPFEKVIEALAPERAINYSPLFQVMFVMENLPKPILLSDGLSVETFTPQFDTAKFDLTLSLIQQENHIDLAFEYKTHLFRDDTITRMAGHYLTLLEAMVRAPETPIDELPLLTATEHSQFAAWNETNRDYPSSALTLHALVADQAVRTPDRVAVESNGQQLTYTDLNQQANALAHILIAHGVTPNAVVGVYMERTATLVVGLLAILKAGAAYMPLDPNQPAERLATMIADANPALLLTDETLRATILTDSVPMVDVSSLTTLGATAEAPMVDVSGEALAYVMYTSGSTGTPKGVQIPHRAVVHFLCGMQAQLGITATDVMVAVTTFAFDISVLELFLPLTVGAKVVIASREVVADGVALGMLVAQSGATIMQATPAGWRLLLAAGWQGQAEFTILCGGEALPTDVAEALLPRSQRLWNLYGPTECTIWTTIAEITEAEEITIGRPLPNTQAYVLDAHLRPVPIGVPGTLYIGGVGLARGYRNRPELTAARFIPNPFSQEPGARLYNTGDIARYRSDGDLLFLGRNDSQVKLRGYRIELGEIESTLTRHPQVAAAVVLLRDVIPNEPALVAYLVSQAGSPFTPHEIRAFLRVLLPDYMIPTYFVTVEHFPLSAAGKIDRKALPTPILEIHEYEDSGAESPVAEAVAEIWQQLLGRERVGFHDDFFTIGGHSLLATQVILRLNETFDLELPVRVLFEEPTIARLAQTIEQTIFDEIAALEESEAQQALLTEK